MTWSRWVSIQFLSPSSRMVDDSGASTAYSSIPRKLAVHRMQKTISSM